MSKENKRFIAKVIPDKEWRKLGCSLRQAWNFMWLNCDESGVYHIDEDRYEFENGGDEFPIEAIKEKLEKYIEINQEKILIKKFIIVNYGNKLSKDYNPHKPLFRKLTDNNLKLDLSLNQACFKLVDEDVYEEEDIEEDVNFEKSEKLLNINDEFLNLVCDYFSQTTEILKMRVYTFLVSKIKNSEYDNFKSQTEAYIKYKKTSGEQSHRWISYVTEWENQDWVNMLKNLKSIDVKKSNEKILVSNR